MSTASVGVVLVVHSIMSSSKVSTEAPLRKYQRRKATPVNLDLSLALPGQTSTQVGSSSVVDVEVVQTFQQQSAPTPIDVDAFDDEVLISSAGAFAEARNNSRRSRTINIIVDVDSGEQMYRAANFYKRRRNSTNCRPVTIDQVFINLEARPVSVKDRCPEQPETVTAPPPPPPPESTFSCPICMGEFVEETSTKCGHIFCKKCIDHAISVKSVCPTCRKKVNKKDVRRIYLPATK